MKNSKNLVQEKSVSLELPFSSIIKEGRIRIEPEASKRILDETNYDGQRKLDHSQAETYAEMMRRSIWLDGSRIAFGRLNGVLYLVNGQHRLFAVVLSGIPQEFQVLIKECKDVSELRELYWRFDAVMKPRTTQQILNAAGVSETNGLSKSMTSAVYRATSFITNDMRSPSNGGGHKSPSNNRIVDVRLETCSLWWEQARVYEKLIAGAQSILRGKLHSASVVAAALVTLKHQPVKAKEFWRGTAANDGLRKGDPRQTLVNFLLTTHDKGSGDVYMGACASAWNPYLAGKTLNQLRPTTPARLNGTPFDGRAHKSAA